MFKLSKSFLNFIVIFMLLMSTYMPIQNAMADTNQYAEIVLGEKIEKVNMDYWQPSYAWVPEEKDGIEGARSNMNGNGGEILLNVSDDFLYNLPLDTPIKVTIEYFDDEAGKISFHYDSNNPAKIWSGVQNNTVWQRIDDIYMTNTKKWKKHSFVLEDLRLSNKLNNGMDIRITVWDPVSGFTAKDFLIRSVRIEKTEYLTPLKVESVKTDKVGNIVGSDEEMTLLCSIRNKVEEKITTELTTEIYDEKGNLINTEKHSVSLESKEKKEEPIKLKKPERFGFYSLKAKFDTHYDSNPEKHGVEEITTDFSVSHVFDADEVDPNYGICNQINKDYGEPNAVGDVLRRGGMSFTRDDLNGGVLENGEWKAPTGYKEKWQTLKERGIETVAILYAPIAGNMAWDRPPTQKEQFELYAQWAEGIARDLKGVIKYFEVWNEYNIHEFNKIDAPPEDYATLLKYAYPAIKRGNPDAVVIGLDTASVPLNWIERVMEAGAYDYMDAYSVHPYDWTGSFGVGNFIENATKLRELLSKYGEMKPIWTTEFGFFVVNSNSSGDNFAGNDGFDFEGQYRSHVLARAINTAYGLYDKFITYCLFDWDPSAGNIHNFGFIKYWGGTAGTAYGAKPSYLGMAAYNHFINQNTEFKNVIDDEGLYAFNFYNKDMNKNVMLMQASSGEGYKQFNLGCTEVTMYDGYGNEVAVINSPNGIYGFSIGNEPIYITGNFSDFSKADSGATVIADKTEIDAVLGDKVTFSFEKNIAKNLKIDIEGIEVAENSGFKGKKAVFKVSVPSDAKRKIDFNVTVKDDDGNVYYTKKYRILISEPVKIALSAEPSTNTNGNRWQIRATVKNMAVENEVNGELKIVAPLNLSTAKNMRTFKNLAPGKSRTFIFTLPEKVNKNVIDVKMNVNLDDGFEKTTESKLNFAISSYAYEKPKIDGVLDNGEWTGSWFGSSEKSSVLDKPAWYGPEDLSFTASSMWDEENFYFVGIATDDVYCIDYSPSGASYMYLGDGFQIALDDRDELNPVDYGSFTEFGISEVKGEGALVYRFMSLYDLPSGLVVEKADAAVKRYDNYTVYECKIPWSEIFMENYEFDYDSMFRFSALVNDNDTNGRGYIEYMSGIGGTKSAGLFGEMKFKK